MRTVKGFALFLSLMLILILSVFAFWLLMISQAHYAASRTLFESENARIISEAAVQYMVQKHNHQKPRMFFDPLQWNQQQLKEYYWNGYRITGSLSASWSTLQTNLLTLRADKGRYASEIQAGIRQLRLEDFALFSNNRQMLSTSTLFDGLVYTPPELIVQKPVRFRGLVYNQVSPEFNASYRRKAEADLEFPLLAELFPPGWNAGGILISGKNPMFWQTDRYVLDLDALDFSAVGKKFRILYQGKTLGDVDWPGISFDDRVQIQQSYQEIPWLSSGKTEQSFYIVSAGDFMIGSSIQALQLNSSVLHLCLVSGNNIQILPVDAETRVEAMLIAFGDVFIDGGAAILAAAEKQSWNSEITGSAFLVEPIAKTDLLKAIENNEMVLWLRGTTAVGGELHVAEDLKQLHFEATRHVHSSLDPFPYVELVEGERQWQ
jgi:hypothetical protein